MNIPSMADPPFACPPDIVLDLPPPVSVNVTRRMDPRRIKRVKEWQDNADKFLLAAKARNEVRFDRIERYELLIVLSEQHCKLDADNGLKIVIDYLHTREITANDAKKNMRRLVVEWGHAPAGVRITIKPIGIQNIGEVARRAEQRAEG